MSLSILRHGVAKYKNVKLPEQEKTKFHAKKGEIALFSELSKTFLDLKPDHIPQLKKNIAEYLTQNEENLKNKKIVIWTSPFGRTMETTSYLIEAIQSVESLKDNIKSISLVEQLEEVKNFAWPILYHFVNGGELEIEGRVVSIDKSITNPDDLSVTDYFFQGGYAKVKPGYLQELGILGRVQSIETYEEITARSKKDLGRIFEAIGEDQFVFLVSHQAMTDWIVVEKDGYKNGGQEAGKFLEI